MGVPTYDRFIEPVLRYLAEHPDGAPARDVHEVAAAALGLSALDRQELLPSGAQPVFKNRAGWAHDRLKRAGLLASVRRGHWQLTPDGLKFAARQRVVLVDGARLAELMIEHEVGVTMRPLRVPRIDSDYFEEESA